MNSAYVERVSSSRSACCSRPAQTWSEGKRHRRSSRQPCNAWPADDADEASLPSTRAPQRVSIPSAPATPTLRAAPQRPSKAAFVPSELTEAQRCAGSAAGSITAHHAREQGQTSSLHVLHAAAAAAAAGHDRHPPADASASVQDASQTLEATVKATTSAQQLQQVLEQHSLQQQLSPQELLLFCNQLSKVQQAAATTVRSWALAQVLLQRLLDMLDPDLDKLNTYEQVVLIAAVARLRHGPSSAWLSRFFSLCEPRLKDSGTGNLTTLARAVSSLGLEPWVVKEVPGFRSWWDTFLGASLKKMHAFRSDELIRLLSSMADLQHKPHAEWMQEFNRALKGKLPTMEPPLLARGMLAFSTLQYEPQRPLLKAYYLQLYSRLPMFDDQDLATTAEAFVVLKRIIKHDFLAEFLEEVLVKLPTFTPITLANLLLALGSLARPTSLQYNLGLPPRFEVPERLNRALSEHLQQHMWEFSGDCLANALWGLFMLGHRPTATFAARCVEASHSKLHAMRNDELIRMLSVLAICKYQPHEARAAATLSSWYREFTKLAGRREYSAKQACDLLSMLAAMHEVPRHLVTPVFVNGVLRSTQASGEPGHLSATRLAGLARSLQVLGHKPDFGAISSLIQDSRFVWTSFKPQEYADLLSALAAFGDASALDPLWVSDFLAVVQCRFDNFSPAAMSKLLVAAVDLPGPVKPGKQWIKLAVARVHQSIGSYSGPQLCNVLLALGRRRFVLSKTGHDSFVQHLAAHVDQLSPHCMPELSSALHATMSAQLKGSVSEQYLQLQKRLRSSLPAPAHTVILQPPSCACHPVPSHLSAPGSMNSLQLAALHSGSEGLHHLPCMSHNASHFSRMQLKEVEVKQLVATEGR